MNPRSAGRMDGRALIKLRETRPAWKKSQREYREMLEAELIRHKATTARLTFNTLDAARLDPGVAVWFSLKKVDNFEWQDALQLENPAPTIDEIDAAYRKVIGKHHPDRISQGSGGDPEIYKQLVTHRKNALAWVRGEHGNNYEHCIPCDAFVEVRHNIAGVRLAALSLASA